MAGRQRFVEVLGAFHPAGKELDVEGAHYPAGVRTEAQENGPVGDAQRSAPAALAVPCCRHRRQSTIASRAAAGRACGLHGVGMALVRSRRPTMPMILSFRAGMVFGAQGGMPGRRRHIVQHDAVVSTDGLAGICRCADAELPGGFDTASA